MCQDTVQEAKVPEKAPRDIKQSPMTQMPESLQSQERLPSIPHKVSEITPHNIEFSVLGMPIVHLNWTGDTPQVVEIIKGKIMPLAAAPTFLQSFAGRISLFLLNWKALTSDPWVIQTIESGYIIRLTTAPVQQSLPHPPHLPTRVASLLKEEIQLLLEKQAVQEVPASTKGFYSNMFMAPKKDSGQKLVINLKYLNKFVKSEHFKMEGLHTVKVLIQKNDWLAKVYLKDAFFMVP